MSSAEAYRENIASARRELEAIRDRFARMRDAGMIYWGTRALKSGSEYQGWLVKGKTADDVFTDRVRAESDLMHWSRLLAEETATPLVVESRAQIAVSEEEKRAFVEKWKAELEARAVAPSPPVEPDARLPPERDDDNIPF